MQGRRVRVSCQYFIGIGEAISPGSMKILLYLLLASFCSLAIADDATFENVTKEADKWGAYPAAIILTAPTATVSSVGDQTTLTLNRVSKLAGITFNLSLIHI